MPRVEFTPVLKRHLSCPPGTIMIAADADSVAAALEVVFAENPTLRGYVLDDQGALRLRAFAAFSGRRSRSARIRFAA